MLTLQQLMQAAPALAMRNIVVMQNPLHFLRGHCVRFCGYLQAQRGERFGRKRIWPAMHDNMQTAGRFMLHTNIACVKCASIGAAKKRSEHLAGQCRRFPVDVKPARSGAMWAELEHVPPPGVRRVRCHMIGHDIEQDSHAGAPDLVRKSPKCRLAPSFWVDCTVVDHIVAMGRARPRLRDWRQVQMAYAQPCEICQVGAY